MCIDVENFKSFILCCAVFCNKIWLFMIYAVLSQNLFYLIYVLLREEKMNKLSLWRKLTNMRYMCMVFSVQRTESFKHMLISLSLILIVFEICLHSCWSAFYSWEQCFCAEIPRQVEDASYCFVYKPPTGWRGWERVPGSNKASTTCLPLPSEQPSVSPPTLATSRDCPPQSVFIRWELVGGSCHQL